MNICRVKGTVVSTTKSEKINGLKLLLVKPIDLETFEEKGGVVVAIDTVDAGEGEIVMTVVSPRQLYRVQQLIREIDPAAFTIVHSVADVRGNGFTTVTEDPPRPSRTRRTSNRYTSTRRRAFRFGTAPSRSGRERA